MLVIGAGVLALGFFVYLSIRAEAGDAGAFAWALWEAVALTLLSSLGVLVALLLSGFKCDESCDDASGDWWHTIDAWQWSGQLLVALGGFAALMVAVVLTKKRRHREAITSAVIAAICFGAWTAFLAPLGEKFGI